MSTWWGSSVEARAARDGSRAASAWRAWRGGCLRLRGGHVRRDGFDGREPRLLPRLKRPLKYHAGEPTRRRPYHLRQQMVDYERPPRVLVVEDDDAIAQVLQRSLRMEGYDVGSPATASARSTRRTRSCPIS